MLTVGSLFSGIGGLELGLERTGGFRTAWQCEIDAYCSEVLKLRWPSVPNLGDITKVDWNEVEKPDVICGGFPCQDISVAGKRRGIAVGTRSGLWFEYLKAVRSLRPRYVVVENVSAISLRGLDTVLAGLAEAGYDAEWLTLRASDVGAPHRRERLFIIATESQEYLDGAPTLAHCVIAGASSLRPEQRDGSHERDAGNERRVAADLRSERVQGVGGEAGDKREVPGAGQRQPAEDDKRSEPDAAHADHDGAPGQAPAAPSREGLQAEPHDDADAPDLHGIGQRNAPDREDETGFPEFRCFKGIREVKELFGRADIPEPLVRGTRNGVPSRLDNYIRRERTKALGNAVVPQVAQIVGEMILQMGADK